MNNVKSNRDIFFIFENKLNNPNANLDKEVRLLDNGINIVTPESFKRKIRDYMNQVLGEEIFYKLDKMNPTTQEDRFIGLTSPTNLDLNEICNKCIDVRLFGITLAIENIKNNRNSTGSIQFNVGQSLNVPNIVNLDGTGCFLSSKKKTQTTLRQDRNVVDYSLIIFKGAYNPVNGKNLYVKENDFDILRTSIWNGIDTYKTTSKNGMKSLYYLEVVYKENYYLNLSVDLFKIMDIDGSDELRPVINSIDDYRIDLSKLNFIIEKNKDIIDNIIIKKYEYFNIDEIKFNYKEI